MNKETVKARIQQIGIVPAIRVSSADDALFAAETVSACGIPVVEMTMTIPGAVEVIRQLTRQHQDIIVGGGTIIDVETGRRCLGAGAHFLSSPGLAIDIVEFAVKEGTVMIPGALTPTEIMLAWRAGSDFVKVFPCSLLGGASYVSALRLPFPDVPFIAAGGVNQLTAADYIRAGAVAVGVGRDLISPAAVKRRAAEWIHELAQRFLKVVAEARGIQ